MPNFTLKLRDDKGRKAWVRHTTSGTFVDRRGTDPVWSLPDGMYAHGMRGLQTVHFSIRDGVISYMRKEDAHLFRPTHTRERQGTRSTVFIVQDEAVRCPCCADEVMTLSKAGVCMPCEETND